jgi:hypothetical protein
VLRFRVAAWPGTAASQLECNPWSSRFRAPTRLGTAISAKPPPSLVFHPLLALLTGLRLRRVCLPLTFHDAQGGRAFELRRTELPIKGWPQLVETWLGTIGMLPKRFVFEAQICNLIAVS